MDTNGLERNAIYSRPSAAASSPPAPQVSLRGLTVAGKIANRTEAGRLGGIYGTNASIVNPTYIRVNNVKSINAAQHNFDVTTPYYGSAGDGAIIPDPSLIVWITDCYANGHGDDGFTTHGSANGTGIRAYCNKTIRNTRSPPPTHPTTTSATRSTVPTNPLQ